MATDKDPLGALAKEIQYFESHRAELLQKYVNMFVLIKEEEVIGAFADAETAYQDGLAKFGLKPFLVRQVLTNDPITVCHMFSLTPHHAHI
jgi:hypothetical protein